MERKTTSNGYLAPQVKEIKVHARKVLCESGSISDMNRAGGQSDEDLF